MNYGANNSLRRKVMGNYVNVSWSDGHEDCLAEYNFNLVRVSNVDVLMRKDGTSTYIEFTPNYFTDAALLSLVDAVVDNTKKVEDAYFKSEVSEIQHTPAIYFGFNVKEGLEDLKEWEYNAKMGYLSDDEYYNYENEYTYRELTKEYLPKDKPITCLGVEIKYDKVFDNWRLPDDSLVQDPILKAYKNERPVLIDAMYAVMQYLISKRSN